MPKSPSKLLVCLCRPHGFTLIELITVVLIVSILALVAIPPFMSGIRKTTFKNKIYSVVELFEQARAQALASEVSANKKIAPGGYGVQLVFADPLDDASTQTATLFIDDWNESVAAPVKLDYADVTGRVLPDGLFTPETSTGAGDGDTVVRTVVIDTLNYLELSELSGRESDGTAWVSTVGNVLTVIFVPPYAETTIVATSGTSSVNLQELTTIFNLKTDPLIGTFELNRVTTTPVVTVSVPPPTP